MYLYRVTLELDDVPTYWWVRAKTRVNAIKQAKKSVKEKEKRNEFEYTVLKVLGATSRI